ncbi:MAG: response regulator [Bacteriovoracaceae bacterium]|nr:response regulator [Bacteriovoracaceae bacterium]
MESGKTPENSNPKGAHELLSVLVVDDEQQICELVQNFLSESVYIEQVVAANNAFHGRQKMQNQDFDFVVVDYAMQGKNGMQFVQDIRKTIQGSQAKVLLISGCLEEENVLQAIQLKIRNILIKPFSRRQLLEKMYQMFELGPEFSLVGDIDSDQEDFKIDFDMEIDFD